MTFIKTQVFDSRFVAKSFEVEFQLISLKNKLKFNKGVWRQIKCKLLLKFYVKGHAVNGNADVDKVNHAKRYIFSLNIFSAVF